MAGLEKCSDGYCEIPGGTFEMGPFYLDPDGRTVTMIGFQLGQTEVSVGQYRASLAQAPGTQLKAVLSGKGVPDLDANKRGDDLPVVGLTFEQKRAYCQAEGGDLPTPAQLHFASLYDEEDSKTGRLVSKGNGFQTTEPVTGGYQNRWGIYNLLGNAWETVLGDGLEFYTRVAQYGSLTNPYPWQIDPIQYLEEIGFGSLYFDQGYISRAISLFGFSDYRSGFRCARPLRP